MEAYERWGMALVRKAERILQSRSDAQDLVHGLFVDLLEKDEMNLELPYLYRAVTNRCLTLLRDEGNRARILAAHDPDARGPARTTCHDRVVDVDLLAKLVDRLDDEEREILVCRFIDDMTQDEIAELCGLSRKTVGKRLERIKDVVASLGGEGAPS
jgi:RNA polymerase sigma-70 factor, ECF subfamily